MNWPVRTQVLSAHGNFDRRSLPVALGAMIAWLAIWGPVDVCAQDVSQRTPEQWDVMRVFIPASQTRDLVRGDYDLVEIKDLERQLEVARAKKKAAWRQIPSLQEAVYVARLERDLIVSEQSRWLFHGRTVHRPFDLGKVSIATHKARLAQPSNDQLLDHQLVSPDGHIFLELEGGTTERWFGFSISPNEADERTFSFQLPTATSARMLVATNLLTELHSDEVVVEHIETPGEVLPATWQTSSAISLGGNVGRQWWLVHLSGVSEFNLSYRPMGEESQSWFKHILRSASIDYVVDEASLDVKAAFELKHINNSDPLRAQLDNRLRVTAVLVNGSAVEWQIRSSLAGDSNLLEIDSSFPASGEDPLIEISAGCDREPEMDLPKLFIAEAYAARGITRVAARGGAFVDSIQGDESVRLYDTQHESAEAVNSKKRDWVGEWIGTPPRLQAAFSSSIRKWAAQSITRFAVQTDWLSANCRVRLQADSVDSNVLRIAVGEGWFVDKVQLIGAEPDEIRAEFSERGTEQQPVTEVIVRWAGNSDSLQAELEVIAHRPLRTNRESIRLFTRRLLTVPNADQIDNYVIEPSGRFKVQPGEQLLRFQLQPVELPDWQQRLLPELAEKWVYQGARNLVPPVTLQASKGAYTARLTTLVREVEINSDLYRSDYILQVQPISGTVDSVAVMVPNVVDWKALRWQTITSEDSVPETVPTSLLSMNAENSLIELKLPLATASDLTLRSSLQFTKNTPANSSAGLPTNATVKPFESLIVPGLTEAVSGDSTLILPRSLAANLALCELEILPSFPYQLPAGVPLPADSYWTEASGAIAARLDLKSPQVLNNPDSVTSNEQRWVWTEEVQSWLDSPSSMSHSVMWQVETGEAGPMEIRLPEDWRAKRISLNGTVIPLPTSGAEAQLSISLPAQRTSHLELRCSSQIKESWFSAVPTHKPTLSCPIFSTRHTIHVPPGKTSFQELAIRAAKGNPLERLHPMDWWGWLSPSSHDASWPSASGSQWRTWRVDESPEEFPANQPIWLIDRAGLSAILLSAVLALTALFWWIMGTSAYRAWACISSWTILVVLAPPTWVGLMQATLLASVLAGLLRLAQIVCSRKPVDPELKRDSRITHSASIPTIGILWLLGIPANVSVAQLSPDPGSGPTSTAEPNVFGVLIPYDSDTGTVSGSYAYVPSQLRDLLNNPEANHRSLTETRILSAEYILRTSATAPNGRDYLPEISADFRIVVAQPNQELRLPFLIDELPLLRAEVNGQTDTLDNAVVQQSDAIVFRARMPGTYLLRLVFDPDIQLDENGHAQLQAQIPAVASATARVIAGSNTRVEIASIGRKQRSGGEILAMLGPTNVLQCRWYSINSASGTPQSVSAQSDLWVHCNASRLAALGVLQLENADNLPEQFRLLMDDNWEPVGTRWGDVELVSSEAMALSNRRIYNVRFTRSALRLPEQPNWIRVLMAPKKNGGGDSVPLPFLNLQEAGQSVVRTMTWSSSQNPTWVPEGVGVWPQMANLSTEHWGQISFAPEATRYRVPAIGFATNLQRREQPGSSSVSEITQVHLSVVEARISYRAEWQNELHHPAALRLRIPFNSRIESALVDGVKAEYEILRKEQQDTLAIIPPDNFPTTRVIDLELTYPIRLRRRLPLPRVVLQDVNASTSIYRVLRGAALECSLHPSEETPIELESINARPTDLLANLESIVGQVDLGERYRKSAELPLEFTLNRRRRVEQIEAVVYVDADQQVATVKTAWHSGNEPMDFVFFDVPANLRESIDAGQLPRRFIPMGDPSRLTFCLVPPPPEDGRTLVQFQFPLDFSASTQAVTIPRIQPLSSEPVRPVVALPADSKQGPIRWKRVGQTPAEGWTDPFRPDDQTRYKYFLSNQTQWQPIWELKNGGRHSGKMLHCAVHLQTSSADQVTGQIDYWIQPAGLNELNIELPPQMHIVGALTGGQPANISSRSASDARLKSLGVVMEPNHLPVNLRLLVRWDDVAKKTKLPLPRTRLGNQNIDCERLIYTQLTNWRIDPSSTGRPASGDLEESWIRRLLDVQPKLEVLPPAVRQAWLSGWQPGIIGVHPDAMLSEASLQALESVESMNSIPISRISDCWEAFCASLDVLPSELLPQDQWTLHQSDESTRFGKRVYSTNQDTVNLIVATPPNPFAPRALSAAFLFLLAVLLLIAARILRPTYFRILAAQPWLFWLQLAILSWIFLPLSWPSYVLAFAAFGMALSQFADYRRTIPYR